MPWTLREDIRKEERCFVMTDAAGNPLGYFQHFPDGTAGYWFELMQQADAARSPEEARERIFGKHFSWLRVEAQDDHGNFYHLATLHGVGQYTSARDLVKTIRQWDQRAEGGAITIPEQNLGEVKIIVSRLRIVADDSTVIDDEHLA